MPPKATPKDGEELLRELYKQNLLTKFQAQQFAQGRDKALILGNYLLIDKIGAGGMGQVFKAEHRRMKRLVAIKMLPKAMLQDAAAAARFQREVEAAAKLEHPNIVHANDADESNGVHFLVMQYVEGSDLSALVKKGGPLSVAKAVNYITQAARGLEFAHKKGVIHRDIKPANLLLDNEGTVKILDMGLARISGGDGNAATQAELTGTGAVMGTVDYMSPEQALDTKHADARADVYSLGCSLFFLLTGKPTYEGDTLMAKLLGHREKAIPSLGTGLPEQVQAVFEKMVAKHVEDRYQTMSEVIADLERCNSSPATSLSLQQSVGTGSSSDVMTFLRNVTLNTINRPKAKAKHAAKAAPAAAAKKNKLAYLAIGTALLSLVILAGVIFKMQSKNGTLVVEVAQPNATGSGSIPPLAKAPFDTAQAKALQSAWAKHLGTTVERTNPVGMTLVLIPPGEFLMGSTPGQNALGVKIAEENDKLKPADTIFNRMKEEMPQHRVALAKPLLMGSTEVTIGQFKKFVEATSFITQAEQYGFGDSTEKTVDEKVTPEQKKKTWQTPGYAVNDDSPVTQVTWNDAVQFCNWLSEQENLKPCYRKDADNWIFLGAASGYRLPTEAEWEYACRAGTTTQFWFGDDAAELERHEWYNKNAGGRARAVGLKSPNPFGLYDMAGNVREWCWDYYDGKSYAASPLSNQVGPSAGSDRVVRGGTWSLNASYCRSAARLNYAPSSRYGKYGFRVVRAFSAAASGGQLAMLPAGLRPELRPREEAGRRPDAGAVSVSKTPRPSSLADQEPNPLVAPFNAKQAHAGQAVWAKHLGTTIEQKNPVGMTMVLMPPGEFLMGSTDEQVEVALKVAEELKVAQGDKDRIQKAERPQHRVVISKPFLMSATEVTIGQFRKFVEATKYVTEAEQYGFGNSGDKTASDKVKPTDRGLNWKSPGYAVTNDSPVAQVTWNDACAYCAWLSEQEQRSPWYRPDGKGGWLIAAYANGYRLPTEAEWEYACRAGTTTQYSFGDDYAELEQYGWFNKNAGGMTKPVALKLPNPFGLFDMHGNLYEWCQDFYDEKWYEKPLSDRQTPANDPKGPSSGSTRVLRGGRWFAGASNCRSAFRDHTSPSNRYSNNGFRPVRVADATADSRLDSGTITTQPNQPWNTPAFQKWMKDVAALPAEKQVEAVAKKLQELNPGFDGVVMGKEENGTPKIERGVVTELGFLTDNVTDVSPVRALAKLKVLRCSSSGNGKGKLADLSPLTGTSLTALYLHGTNVSDLSPLKGMSLTKLSMSWSTKVFDLSPLQGMRSGNPELHRDGNQRLDASQSNAADRL